MAANGKVPVVRAAKAGLAFLRENWRRYLAGAAICGLAAGWASAAQALYARDGGPQFLHTVVALASVLLTSIFFQTAAMRQALKGGDPGRLALETGPDAFRVLGVSVQVGFFLVLLIVPIVLASSIVLGVLIDGRGVDPNSVGQDPAALMAALGPGGGAILTVLGLAALAGLLWFYSRLTLAVPATVAEGRMMAFRTWRWTRGNGWRILGAVLLLTVPLSLATGLIASVLQSMAGTPLGNPAAMLQEGELVRSPLLIAAVGAVQGFLNTLVVGLASVGVTAFLYRGLRPQEETITIA
jgi:hypothetical protein